MGRRVIDGCHEAILTRLDNFCGIYGALSAGRPASESPAFRFCLHFFTGSQPPENKTRQNGSKPPPRTQRHQNKAMQTLGKPFYSNYFPHIAFRVMFEANKGCFLASLGNLLLPRANDETSFNIINSCANL